VGIKEVILPYKNTKEISELPKDLLKGLKLRKIKKVDEALRIVFGPSLFKHPKAKSRPMAEKTAPKKKK